MSVSTQDSASLKREAVGGMAWLLAQSVVARGFTMGSQLVLAWLLSPNDFGTIGLATTVTALASALVAFGIDEVLLQRQRTIGLWVTAAFWMTTVLGGAGFILVLLAAPWAGAVYHSAELPGLITVLAMAIPLGALAIIPGVRLRADMRFRFLATYNMAEIVGLQGGTILLAALGAGPYSFAIPVPCVALVKLVLFWSKAPSRPWPRLQQRHLAYLASKGSAVLAQRLITEAVGQGGYIILGLLATQSVVGVYFFAFRLATQPIRMLAGSFQNVLFPALARLRTEPARQGQAALKAAQALGYTVMPFCFLQAALAGPLLHLVFGPKWASAVPLVQILSIGLAFDAISWIAGCLLAARAEFGLGFRYSLMLSPNFFILAYIGARLGSAEGMAWGVSAFYALLTPCYSWLVFRRVGVSLRGLASFYITPALAAAATIGIAYLGSTLVADDLLRCAVIGLVGPGLYVLVLSLLHPALLASAVAWLRHKCPSPLLPVLQRILHPFGA